MTRSVFTETYDRFRVMLIEARKKAGLTQVELAERLQQSQTYVSRYERGERRLDVVEFLELTDLLDIDPHEFIERLLDRPSSSKP